MGVEKRRLAKGVWHGGRTIAGRFFFFEAYAQLPVRTADRATNEEKCPMTAPTEEASSREPSTLALARPAVAESLRCAILIGKGAAARRVPITAKGIVVGSSDRADVTLSDRAVSGLHLNVALAREGVIVRDLDSRNGTWLGGIRVDHAVVMPGAVLRAGRTDLTIVEEGRHVDGGGIVAASPEMQSVLAEVDRFAQVAWPLLLCGESGVGKEALARRVHDRSSRANGPYVVLNAACVPRELVESELFGHERGSFTGATGSHAGVFEQAHGGTLFLDEIGELSLDMQSRLLRVLETWDVRRVGGSTSRRVDVRVVCATHRNLRAMVDAGTFRLDLYYRLARLVVEVPPLRARRADVDALVDHFLAIGAKETGHRSISNEARKHLKRERFLGNARELRNVLGVASVLAAAPVIEVHDIEAALERVSHRPRAPMTSDDGLRETLAEHAGNVAAAARSLGIARSTLRDRLRASEPPANAKVDEVLGDSANAA